MIRRVRFTPAALDDVERLAAFIAPHSPLAARRLVERLRDKAASLSTLAERGRQAQELGYREVVTRSGASAYVMVCRLDADAVVIFRIWHAREDRRGLTPDAG